MGTGMEIVVDIDYYSIDDDNIDMLSDSFGGLGGRFLDVDVEGEGVVVGVGSSSMGLFCLVGLGSGNYSSLFICVEVICIYSTAIKLSNIY